MKQQEVAARHGVSPAHPVPHAPETKQPEAPTAPAAAQRLAFLVMLLLFLAWLGWLGFLGFTTQTPVVLSRPQFLVSAVDVVAVIDQFAEGSQQVKVKQVLWSGSEPPNDLAGKTITITNLDQTHGGREAGEYLLPLIPDGGQNSWQVVPVPRNPGSGKVDVAIIYPATQQVVAQHARMPKPAR